MSRNVSIFPLDLDKRLIAYARPPRDRSRAASSAHRGTTTSLAATASLQKRSCRIKVMGQVIYSAMIVRKVRAGFRPGERAERWSEGRERIEGARRAKGWLLHGVTSGMKSAYGNAVKAADIRPR